MTLLDIVSIYPATEAVFKTYDEQVGECLCCQRLFETVEQIGERYKLDLAEILEKLNATVTD
ncbi:MAG: hypothetical protein DRH07_02915 [Deltaproteobacteria bacterium]|nr:MAG: hypothetical protein DRH07_02915 [Deltaproteobacteria bacterium]